jgi:hypothetical protein
MFGVKPLAVFNDKPPAPMELCGWIIKDVLWLEPGVVVMVCPPKDVLIGLPGIRAVDADDAD